MQKTFSIFLTCYWSMYRGWKEKSEFKKQIVYYRLPFARKLRSSSISRQIEVVFQLPKKWGHLSFTNKLRSSSLFSLPADVESSFDTFTGWTGGRVGGPWLSLCCHTWCVSVDLQLIHHQNLETPYATYYPTNYVG